LVIRRSLLPGRLTKLVNRSDRTVQALPFIINAPAALRLDPEHGVQAMSQGTHTVKVAKDLEDLIPVFMKNRVKEVESLKQAMSAGDFEQLRQLGHRMKGVGNSYGFAYVSEVGKRVEDAARESNTTALAACVDDYAAYLSKVQIVYE
jgi:HPt (histidine-containing phosphotransfer) domain-containing protein